MELLLWAIGGGFAGTWMMIFYMSKQINGRLNSMNSRMDKMNDRMDKMMDTVMDLDRRVSRIEGMLMNKECCMISQSHRRAE